jgi:hypothetical protein
VLEPNRDQIEIFIEALFRHAAPGNYLSLRSFVEEGGKPFQIVSLQIDGSMLPLIDLSETMARQAANNSERIVFCPPVCTFRDARTAEEKDVAEGLVLSAECDANPQQSRERLESLLGPATLAIRSGGRWTNGNDESADKLHLHWRLAVPATSKEMLERLRTARKIAAKIGGTDPSGIPVSHCYRWPGSWHRKDEPRLCEIETADSDREINLDHALDILRKAAGEEQPEQSSKPPAQTSLDWPGAFRDILTGAKYHPVLTPLAGSFAALGAPESITEKVLRALMENSAPADPARLKRRDEELEKLPATIRSGYEKYAAHPPALFDPWAEYPVPEFPIEILPPIAQEFVSSQSITIGCDPAGMAMATLATFSGAMSHRFALRMMRHGRWWENNRLWVLLCGDPSKKKTPVINEATRPLEEHQDMILQQHHERMREYKAAKNDDDDGSSKSDKPKPPPRFVIYDSTVEML